VPETTLGVLGPLRPVLGLVILGLLIPWLVDRMQGPIRSFRWPTDMTPVFSLNVPVPGEVRRLGGELRPWLAAFESIRERHTLVAKRLDDTAEGGRARVEGRARRALAGAPAFEARVTGIDFFAEPTAGTAPVVYFEVESPGLIQLHERLVDVFGALDGVEGPEYTPHITLARGGAMETAERLAEREIDPVTWTVSELRFFDVRYREWVGKVSLPG